MLNSVFNPSICVSTGAEPGFFFGGGGAKDYVRVYAHYKREAQSPLRPESLLGFWCSLVLSDNLTLIFKQSETKRA